MTNKSRLEKLEFSSARAKGRCADSMLISTPELWMKSVDEVNAHRADLRRQGVNVPDYTPPNGMPMIAELFV